MNLPLLFFRIQKVLVFSCEAVMTNHFQGIGIMVNNSVTYIVFLSTVLTSDLVILIQTFEELLGVVFLPHIGLPGGKEKW